MSNAVEDFLQALKRTINGDPYPAPNPARYAPVSYRVTNLKDPLAGEMLAEKYCIESRIGKGAMAVVYKAVQKPIDRVVAVKILNHNYSRDMIAVKRFKLEAKTLSTLRHRNILSVLDLGNTENGQPFFVMEFLDGISLESLIEKRGPVPVARAVPIFGQICDALAYAHAQGVIHRDLKPGNVMLLREENGDELVKLVDFGIVKVDKKLQLISQQLTKRGEVWGSPVYMSPEQCKGEELDARADVYSLGLLMYESLLGTAAISGANIGAIVSAQLTKKPASFHEAVPELRIPDSLERIVFRTLEKNKDDRFSSMEELKAALESCAAQYGIKIRKTTGAYARQADSDETQPVRTYVGRLEESEATTQAPLINSAGAGAPGISAAGTRQTPLAASPDSRSVAPTGSREPRPGTPGSPVGMAEPEPGPRASSARSSAQIVDVPAGSRLNLPLLLGSIIGGIIIVGGGIFLYQNLNKASTTPTPVAIPSRSKEPVATTKSAQPVEVKPVEEKTETVKTSEEAAKKPLEKPVEKTVEKPVEKATEKPVQPTKSPKHPAQKIAKNKSRSQNKQAAMDDDALLEKWTLRKHKTDSTQQWLDIQQRERQ